MLAEAGIRLVGENRAQDLQAKVAAHGELFEWDFIGQLQSRRVRLIVPHVRLIHSVASDSALRELGRHRRARSPRPAHPDRGERRRARRARPASRPDELDAFIARSPVPVAGLMTMPPFARDPEDSRRWFAALRELADERGLEHLSMGTSQDYLVAVEEGATIVRIGTKLYDSASPARPPRMTSISRETGLPGEDAPTPMAFRDSWHRALVYFGLAEEYHDDYEDAPPGGGDRGSLPRAPERPPAAPPARRVRRHLRRGRPLGDRGRASAGVDAVARPPC